MTRTCTNIWVRQQKSLIAYLFAVLIVMMHGAFVSAHAHPHVFVTVTSQLVYDKDAKLQSIRHSWIFDAAYSSFATQGLDKNGDGTLDKSELADLAKVNVESLNEFGYFTTVKANGLKQDLSDPINYSLVFENGQLTLSFTLPLKTEAKADKLVVLEIFDPTYFVAFGMADSPDAATLISAPTGCAITITKPKSLDVSKQQSLSESFFENLAPTSDFGLQFANRVMIACP